MDNLDQLISETITTINDRSGEIGEILRTEAASVGTTLTESLNSLWGKEGSATTVLSDFKGAFETRATTLQTAIGGILKAVKKLGIEADKNAGKDIKDSKPGSEGNPEVHKDKGKKDEEPEKPVTPKTDNKKKSTGDGKIKVGEKVKFASGSYYATSAGTGGSGNKYRGKEVYVTKINSKGKKPYHISTGKKLGKGDLGWVTKKQLSGYWRGTNFVEDDELARINEQGQEIITLPDGSILTPLKRGSGVINNPNTEKLLGLADNYDVLQRIASSVDTGNLVRGDVGLNNVALAGNRGNTTVDSNITFNLPNVYTPEDFMSFITHNKKAQQALTDMIVSPLNGGSSLKKYRNGF